MRETEAYWLALTPDLPLHPQISEGARTWKSSPFSAGLAPAASKLAPHPEAGLPPPGYPMPRGWTDGSVGLASRAARRSRDIKGCQDLFGLPVHVSYPEGPDDDSFLLTGPFDLCPSPKPLLGHKCLPFRSLEGSPCSVGFFLCHRLPLARAPTSWGSAFIGPRRPCSQTRHGSPMRSLTLSLHPDPGLLCW